MVGQSEHGPPPSTYAAQIVDNIENAKSRSFPSSSRAHLNELLRRVLEADRQGVFDNGAFDSSLEVNHKLICVIVRACLMFPTSPDPFDHRIDGFEQARDSLAVIELSIRKAPEVLWVSLDNENTYDRPEGPLFLWLIPHLLNLFHYDLGRDVQDGAQRVLLTVLSTPKCAPRSRDANLQILHFVQACANDLIRHVEHVTQACDGEPNTRQVPNELAARPAAGSILSILARSSRAQQGHLPQALSIIARCLSALALWTSSRSKGNLQPIKRWIVDATRRTQTVLVARIYLLPRDALEPAACDLLDSSRHYLSNVSVAQCDSLASSIAADQACRSIANLLHLCQGASSKPVSSLAQESLCWGLYAIVSGSLSNPSIWKYYEEHLASLVLDVIGDSNVLRALTKDLQRGLVLTTSVLLVEMDFGTQELFDFDSVELRESFEAILKTKGRASDDEQVPASKRLRALKGAPVENAGASGNSLSARICQVLHTNYSEQDNILLTITVNFHSLSYPDQALLLDIVGKEACAQFQENADEHCGSCDLDEGSKERFLPESISKSLYEIISTLVKLCQEQKSPRPRVAAMLAVNRILGHTSQLDHLDLRNSPLAQWTLRSLRSSIRDLRLAAVKAASNLLVARLPAKLLMHNRLQTFEALKGISDNGDLPSQETCVLALSSFAKRVLAEEEINLVLLRLIECLGHANPLVSNLAYEELQRLSSHSSATAHRLLEPYWRSLAIVVVKDLQTRPQICQSVCDLLAIGVPDFLKMTQFFTIPFLVSTRKRDILQRIADANGSQHDILTICSEKDQLAAILTCLLLQPSPEPENMILSLLSDASPGFDNIDLQEIFKSDPTRIAFELLKAAGEHDGDGKVRARRAVRVLAEKIQRKNSKKYDAVSVLFEESALGIIQLLSEVIAQTEGPQQLGERKRCIGAIQEMALVARSHLCNALPQITSCLRSTIEEGTLSNEAFEAWMALVKALDEEDIETLIDPTFAIVAEHWESFDADIQQSAHDMISSLLKTHSSMIRAMVTTIPSLGGIPLLKKFETEIGRLKAQMDPKNQFLAFVKRCQSENVTVIARAMRELHAYLVNNQAYLHVSVTSEQPDPVIAVLIQTLLHCCLKFSDLKVEIAANAARCLGMIGCVDPTKVELPKENQDIIVLSDFVSGEETIDFVVFLFQEVLVKAFLSTTDTRSQGLLAYAIQELLRNCGFDASNTVRKDLQPDEMYKRWIAIPEAIRNTLTPFLSSKYVLEPLAAIPAATYPIYAPELSQSTWVRQFVFDLLGKCHGKNASMVFSICRRIVRRQDISVATFILPFITLNVILEGNIKRLDEITTEFLSVLSRPLQEASQAARENLILCSHNLFRVLDYLSRWVQEKRKEVARFKNPAPRGRELSENILNIELTKLFNVEHFLGRIPPETMSKRAIDCKSFSRALFHWEDYIREQRIRNVSSDHMELLYQQLQDIYSQIDEPDGIEGISAHMHVITVDQQVLEHRKAGRWTAAQSWYELELNEDPENTEVQIDLLTSLRESGQYDALLNQVSSFHLTDRSSIMVLPFVAEASWMSGRWDRLEQLTNSQSSRKSSNFDVGIGQAVVALLRKDDSGLATTTNVLRTRLTRSLTRAHIDSLQACHEILLRFQILTELEEIAGLPLDQQHNSKTSVGTLEQRLSVIGAFTSEKQYLLGLRRAAMQLSKFTLAPADLSASWLYSAKLARKGNFTHQAFNAVLHATQLGDHAATIETARLLWKDGHNRKAIQTLEGAIAANIFESDETQAPTDSLSRSVAQGGRVQNPVAAQAHLLLAKWLDHAGQTQSDAIIKQYRTAVNFHPRSEKGHYYLGKHYNKLLESEKSKPPAKQAQTFITGEMAKLVIENYLRSLGMGAKYIHQTLPRIIALWLDLGTDVGKAVDSKYGSDHNFREHITNQRQKIFNAIMAQMKKYIDRLPAFVFYSALAQMVARVCHPHDKIHSSLVDIVAKVVVAHPQQTTWTLLAMLKSKKQEDRVQRGREVWSKVQEISKRMTSETQRAEVIKIVQQGQKLSDLLLHVCNKDVGKHGTVSLSADLTFSHKAAPCRLAIPIEAGLVATLPSVNENIKTHKAFPKDTVTIDAFLDEVLVLNSLIKPKKISIRGSDGRIYGLMCKPKDDLRKDQRLLKFNSMITRLLKKDAECSKRRLYIKTYAVTPLNEECGLIEWVEGVRTLRDILLDLYKAKGVPLNYSAMKEVLDEVSNDVQKLPKFHEQVLSKFAPVFHEWFVDMFPEPSAWFEARLKYTRSCAVMSMVGHVLGLGDRHGENILFQGENGGTFHVDFNCLFDKGLTFEKPERVPFRLTHNMVDAFGAYGYEGPFRKTCELTMGILRQHEHTLMTILETFLYDPTTDFIGKERKTASIIPDTPEGVLEAIRTKVRGLLPGESMPLSVEGHVHLLIQEATDTFNLARMYIGWCPFF